MKTFNDLTSTSQLEQAAILAANNAANTVTNKITFQDLKGQILNGKVSEVSLSGTTLNVYHEGSDSPTQYTTQDTWTALGGATSSAAGTAGYAPAPPSDGYNTKYLRADGTWAEPTDTWEAMTGATSSAAGTAGYVPAPPANGYDTKFLKADGTWTDPIANLGTAATADITNTYDPEGTDPISGTGVAAALATLPEPMVFKGSLGTGGTIATLPDASASGTTKNTGFTYRVITDGTYASQAAKVGDTFISTGTSWVLIPSGDEPSGTVTSVAVSNGNGIALSGDTTITSSGTVTISHGATSSMASTSNSGRTYVQNINVDDFGHVTSVTTATETVEDTDTWNAMTGATSSAAGTAGYVPAPPSDGYNTKYLRADGTWVAPPNNDTHYESKTVVAATGTGQEDAEADNGEVYLNHIENDTVVSAHNISGSGATEVTSDENGNITITSTDTWEAMVGAGENTNGSAGYVPAPLADGYDTKFLKADGTWSVPPDTWNALVGASSSAAGTAGYAPAPPSDGYNTKYLRADGTWAEPDTWDIMTGATSSEAGTAGYAPAPPSDGYNTKYLRADGTWAVPSDNDTWTAMTGATSSAAGTAGYVPAPPSDGYNTKFLKADGTWTDPLTGLGTAATQNTTDTYDPEGTAPISGTGVAAALATLPEPMVFKGSLGTGGTITVLPAASASGSTKNVGFTYRVITDGTYDSQAAKAGDTFISTGTSWVLIPSGDEPDGTVTSVAVSNGSGIAVSGDTTITTSGTVTISHGATSSMASTSNSGRTYVQNINVDSFGHVTSVTTATETVEDTNTWNALVGASSSAAGTAGYAPAPPSDGYNTKYLRADGTWAIPPDNNTWTAMVGATSGANGTAGYVPIPPSDGYNTKYLRADGSWAVPAAPLTEIDGGAE